MNKPNLFIVGLPKCGTTFLYHYLSKHPQIFFPKFKEPHYFGSDLIRQNGSYSLNFEEYISLFNSKKKIIGEASTFYMFSKLASREIYKFNPNAKIIIMLRDLVDLAHSMHSQFVFSGDEKIEDFESALKAEKKRYELREKPKQTTILNKLFYKNNILSIPENIRSFQELFGKENIKFIFLDEIQNNPRKVLKDTFLFLKVDNNFPIENFKVINQNKRYRFKFVRDFIKNFSIKLGKIRSFFIAKPIGIIKFLENINKIETQRKSLPKNLKQDLKKYFSKTENEINQLIKS